MKTVQSRLPRVVQRTFLVLEFMVVLLTVILLAVLLLTGDSKISRETTSADGTTRSRAYISMSLSDVGVQLTPETYVLKHAGTDAGGLELDDVRATLSTSDPTVGAAYLKAVRGAMFFFLLFAGVSGVMICDLFRRVFQQVADGESFTATNVKYVRWIGLLVFFGTIGIAALSGWAKYSAASFISDNIEIQGIEIDPAPYSPEGTFGIQINNFPLHINVSGVLAGLMILALGEAFRQGLKLKEDNELTV